MKLMVSSLTVLLLQVNAGAALVGGMLKRDSACSFAKSVDMSANSSLCEHDVVDARTTKGGPARVMLVGEEKKMEKKDAIKSSAPPSPSMLTNEQKKSAKDLAYNFGVFILVVGGVGLFVLLLL